MVERRQACYEVWPDWALVEGRKVQVGFEVDLCADAEGLGGEPCVGIYEELKQIATAVLPRDAGEAEFDVLPFDNSFHESPRRSFRPEIVLALRILHRRGFDRPLDDCEKQCLRQIEATLKQLGLTRKLAACRGENVSMTAP
jgi:hypothetical protein